MGPRAGRGRAGMCTQGWAVLNPLSPVPGLGSRPGAGGGGGCLSFLPGNSSERPAEGPSPGLWPPGYPHFRRTSVLPFGLTVCPSPSPHEAELCGSLGPTPPGLHLFPPHRASVWGSFGEDRRPCPDTPLGLLASSSGPGRPEDAPVLGPRAGSF